MPAPNPVAACWPEVGAGACHRAHSAPAHSPLAHHGLQALKASIQAHLRLNFSRQESSDEELLAELPTGVRRRILRHLYGEVGGAAALYCGACWVHPPPPSLPGTPPPACWRQALARSWRLLAGAEQKHPQHHLWAHHP